LSPNAGVVHPGLRDWSLVKVSSVGELGNAADAADALAPQAITAVSIVIEAANHRRVLGPVFEVKFLIEVLR
jgi:hypothetical protein